MNKLEKLREVWGTLTIPMLMSILKEEPSLIQFMENPPKSFRDIVLKIDPLNAKWIREISPENRRIHEEKLRKLIGDPNRRVSLPPSPVFCPGRY